MIDLSTEEFFCDLDLTGQVKDLTLLNERTHYTQEIEITCRVRSYPEAKIKWVSGQRTLDKMFTLENKQFNMIDERSYNSTERLFTVDSKLIVSFSGHIGKVNFSCRSFYLTPASNDLTTAQPLHLIKTIQFNIKSDDDQINTNMASIGGDLPDDLSEYSMNSTMLMMKEASYRSVRERPLIYWLLLGIFVLFVLLVILVVSILLIRHYSVKKRKQRVRLDFLNGVKMSIKSRN